MNGRATCTRMEPSTAADWQKIGGEVRRAFAQPKNSPYKAAVGAEAPTAAA
jgi:hypothetical protein